MGAANTKTYREMKFAIACAIASVAAYGAETETEWDGRGYAGPAAYGYGAEPAYGYAVPAAPAEGKGWSRRSTWRPRDVKAYNAEPVDPYYFKDEAVTKETIIASCEFDFQGHSKSTGRMEFK